MEKAKNVRVESDLYEDETSMDRLDEELEKGLGRRNSITDTSEKEFEIKDATLDSGDSNPIHGKQRKNSKDEEEEGKGENERTYTESDAISMAKGGKKESGEKVNRWKGRRWRISLRVTPPPTDSQRIRGIPQNTAL